MRKNNSVVETRNINETGLLKSAIFLAAMPENEAEVVLEQFDREIAELVRRRMAYLKDVPEDLEEKILTEFTDLAGPDLQRQEKKIKRGLSRQKRQKVSHELEFDGENFNHNATRAVGYAPATPSASEVRKRKKQLERQAMSSAARNEPSHTQEAAFQSLHKQQAEQLVTALTCERAQTIGVVLAHLPEELAREVLLLLPPQQQTEVVQRMVALDQTSPEVLCAIEETVLKRLRRAFPLSNDSKPGASVVKKLLASKQGDQIIENLAKENKVLADQLAGELPAFQKLLDLPNATLKTICERAGVETVAMALLGTDIGFAKYFLQSLPKRDAKAIKHAMNNTSTFRLRDVDQAKDTLRKLGRRYFKQRDEQVKHIEKIVPKRGMNNLFA